MRSTDGSCMIYFGEKGAHVLHDVFDGGGDDDAAGILVVQRDGLLVLERGGHPVVQCDIELRLVLIDLCLFPDNL